MKFKCLLLFLIMMLLITGCGNKSEENIDILDQTQDILEEVEKSKKAAAQVSAYSLKKSVELYYQIILLELFEFDTIKFTCSDNGCISDSGVLDLDGIIPSSGEIILNSDGSMLFSGIIINGYNCDIPTEGEIVCSK